eukprot:2832226-Amphidinium_carterae.1
MNSVIILKEWNTFPAILRHSSNSNLLVLPASREYLSSQTDTIYSKIVKSFLLVDGAQLVCSNCLGSASLFCPEAKATKSHSMWCRVREVERDKAPDLRTPRTTPEPPETIE